MTNSHGRAKDANDDDNNNNHNAHLSSNSIDKYTSKSCD